ncbi:DUF4344 domain-containing metallopeptidase [Actinomadura sp. ATCC 31491]|uniref:DUF4344 domain-containing metallopeptidase n=1 Tax=Actinomadura luzonensis TaxID=2805427 RepID=A0ABT0GB22_9ACTN|nr:DUF4344 domain-containing metallopeptidase [Actinomadura luzonensis]MCK2221809.1 DUF4344 domain-containing metallopeptidase [Actinomadura luzonensis]
MPHPLVALALSTASALGAAPSPAPAETPAVRYEPAGSPRAEQARRLLRESEALRTRIRLPQPVEVVARDCAGPPASWDAAQRRITLCYAGVDRLRRTLTGIAETEEADARTAGRRLDAALSVLFHHQLGHALGTLNGLPDAEDQADRLAALTLAADRPARAVPAAEARHLLAAGHDGLTGHPEGAEESATFACLLYGADPAANAAIAKGGWVPAQRAPSCAAEYGRVKAAAGSLVVKEP